MYLPFSTAYLNFV